MAKSSAKLTWSGEDTLIANTRNLAPRIDKAVTAATDLYGMRIETAAKKNAPWTDRTGNARNGLRTMVFHGDKEHVIVLYHQVSYGIWLEVRWDGRYEIIRPTINNQGKALMKMLNRLMDRLGKA